MSSSDDIPKDGDLKPGLAREMRAAQAENKLWKWKADTAENKQFWLKIDPDAAKQNNGEISGGPRTDLQRSIDRALADRAYLAAIGPALKQYESYLNPAESTNMNANKPEITPQQAGQFAREYHDYLVSMGKSADEIVEHMQKVMPTLQAAQAASRGNPLFGQFMYPQIASNERLGPKDVIELALKFKELNPAPQQSDPAAMITAMGTFMSAMKEDRAAGADPATAFQNGMNAMAPIMQQMNDANRQAFTMQIEMLKTQLDKSDPAAFIERIQNINDKFGWGPQQDESEDIKKHRLHIQDQQEQRKYDWMKFQYETESKRQDEAAKQKNQQQLIQGVTSSLEKIVESPVIKELGKGVGAKIGVPNNPIAAAQSAAAKSQLDNPTEIPYQFQCAKCKTVHTFSAKELTLIQEKGGNWVCPNCSEAYKLKR